MEILSPLRNAKEKPVADNKLPSLRRFYVGLPIDGIIAGSVAVQKPILGFGIGEASEEVVYRPCQKLRFYPVCSNIVYFPQVAVGIVPVRGALCGFG